MHSAGIAIAATIQDFIKFAGASGAATTDGEALMQSSLSEFLVIALYGFFGVYLPHRIFKAMSPQSAVKLRLGMARDKIAGSVKADPGFPIEQVMDGGAAHESICRGEIQIKKRTQPFADDRLAAKTESFDFGKNPIRKNAAYTKFCVCSAARVSENVKNRLAQQSAQDCQALSKSATTSRTVHGVTAPCQSAENVLCAKEASREKS